MSNLSEDRVVEHLLAGILPRTRPRRADAREIEVALRSLIVMEEDTLSLDSLPLCFDARFWLGSGIMLLELTEEGEVRSSARAGARHLRSGCTPCRSPCGRTESSPPPPSPGLPRGDDPNPNHPILSAEHDVDESRLVGEASGSAAPDVCDEGGGPRHR